jgi:hypothetical protein
MPRTPKTDPLAPAPALLCKLASIAVHVQELLSPFGHHFDQIATDNLLKDREVVEWLKQMHAQGMAPEPRNK